ncbi:MAG: cation-translocating P-type ATPase [Anaerolineaceae bacterium]|nr:cation-translocating P-type ATPase [Anaerolineaceae bacterium]
MKNWFTRQPQEILKEMDSNLENGLAINEVTARQQKYGANELIDRGTKSPWKIIFEQLKGTMVLILIIAAVIMFFLQEYKDAIVIMIIVVLNAGLGFSQEYRAEQAMAALKKMSTPKVRVRRGGHVSEISSRELVPGDIILLEAGNSIPADGSLIESANFRVQESILTGESEAVEKDLEPILKEDPALGDQHNRVFMGTLATFGRATAVVTDIGMDTELGKIAELIQSVGSEQTPLQRRLDQLGKSLAVAALVIVVVVFLLGILRGEPVRTMFMTGISMAVAAVPEGLPAVVTIALAMGAQRMLKRNALIRKLPAVETLGSVTTICSDKTGTLTENRMTVTLVDVAGNRTDLIESLRSYTPTISDAESSAAPIIDQSSGLALMLAGGALCNDAILEHTEEGFSSVGDPTEGALVVAAVRAGLWKDKLEKALPRVAELPFDSDRKRMTTVHKIDHPEKLPNSLQELIQSPAFLADEPFLSITKGSADGLLEISNRVWSENEIVTMDENWRERIMKAHDDLAQKGMRILGVAFRQCSGEQAKPECENLEEDLVFVGMFAMIDPARSEVKDAVAEANTAGIRPIMITGDHPLTALHIAKELGIAKNEDVITGAELAKMDDATLKKRVSDTSVFARVSPEHKLRIVKALQELGQIVAMTGDGVNDAPALKKADIGVAMGITGTDVSKEAADMVLLDDNFATIVSAVREGRRIYENIRKFIKYTMTSNFGEIVVMLVGPFVGLGLPLLPLQILWVNLVTDGLPGLALTQEPSEPNAMKRPPRDPKEKIFGRGLGWDVLWIGALMGAVSLAVGLWAFNNGHPETWQTMVFTTLTIAQMGNALATRSASQTVFEAGLFKNKMMFGSVMLTFVLQMAVVYLPFLQDVFGTKSLSLMELGISFVASLVVMFAIDTVKLIKRKAKKEISE